MKKLKKHRMENLTQILNIVLASGLIGQFIFFRSKKRKAKTEADIGEFDALKNQVAHFSQQLKESYEEIDKMQDIIDRERNSHVELSRQLSEIKIKLVEEEERRYLAERNICTVIDCDKRIPPRNKA